MMNFAQIMSEEAVWTKTENGADARNTTGNALLDFFSQAGALRERAESDICLLFEKAANTDKLGAIRTLFYARDIREGLGERRTFRILLKYLAGKHPDLLKKNLALVPEYGRWDDLYELVNTPLEQDIFALMKQQFLTDETAMAENRLCSLLAKWLKKADASSTATKTLGIRTAKAFGMSVYEYKRRCVRLRRHIDVVEQRMSEQNWDEIRYSAVPSHAMKQYRKAFRRHDENRFQEYLENVKSGKEKIHAGTLYPYDIIRPLLMGNGTEPETINTLWNALPDFVKQNVNAVIMADVSFSMYEADAMPICVSVSLALYFAERNSGAYHNKFMTFSEKPEFIELDNALPLSDRIRTMQQTYWAMNTDLDAALKEILRLAVENSCPPEDMPKALIIISDMQIDEADEKSRSDFYTRAEKAFREAGYETPAIVFWNVNSKRNAFQADMNRPGVQLVSGAAASTFQTIIDSIGKTPLETMYCVLNSPRYAAVTL